QDQKPDRYELHRILIPLDGSTLAEAALQQAKVIAGEHRAQLIVTRVVEPLSSWQKAIIIEGGFNPDALEQERFEEAQQYLDRICTELGADHVAGIGRLFTGTASEAILHLLREEAVDLVVMSTHGLSGYSRWVYGSVAGKVLHSASCPLLLLRSVEVAKNAVPVSP
ncbi:MAG: universal stress protein, partial [Caldilineaceae bacterium]